MYAMACEPYPEMSAENFLNFFKNRDSVEDIVLAYAIAHNKFWWLEDDRYDFEEGSEEYIKVCAIVEEWRKHMDFYQNKIFEMLIAEGVAIPQNRRIEVLAPFMKRYGYIDGNGWWIKE